MINRVFNTKIIYLSMLLLIASAGTIFFFPMNIDGKYTCFYHRLFDHTHPVSEASGPKQHDEGRQDLSISAGHSLRSKVMEIDEINPSHHNSDLLDTYLHQYALPWWASVGLLAFTIYLIPKLKKSLRQKNLSLMINQ